MLKIQERKLNNAIFVVGMPRSGTTIISEAIASHEDIGWFPNYMNKFPAVPSISLLTRIVDLPRFGWFLRGKKDQDNDLCSFIRSLLPYSVEAFPVWDRYCGKKFSWEYLLNQTAAYDERKRITNIIEKVLRYQGKKRFSAKITGPSRICYLKSIFPDAYFVHVLRDPRATVSSLLNVSFWKKGGGYEKPWWKNGLCEELIEKWNSYDRSPVALAAVQWVQIVEYAWQEMMALENAKYMEIHYEDFVRDPMQVVKNALERLDLPFSQNVERFIRSIAYVQNDMNDKYKRYLSAKDIEMIDEITGPTARKAGYSI